jgi:mRNA interferase MazF
VQRGDFWWARLDEKRPVVILSRDESPEVRAMIIVAPAATDLRDVAVEVSVGADDGLPEGVLRVALPRADPILCSWLVTLARADLLEHVGAMSPAKLHQFEEALRLAGLE